MDKKRLLNLKQGDLAVVVGSGASGIAASRLLHRTGARVRMLDSREDAFDEEFLREHAGDGLEFVVGPHKPEHFQGAALVVPSPGVPMRVLTPLLAEAGNPLWMSELELGFHYVKEPILAVTGTSGKTTTSSLAAAMLEASGKKVFLGGNIGTPLSEYIVERELTGVTADVLVLEVSSFQLLGCSSFSPQVGMLLNLSENHLDQHKDMQEYVDCKFKLFSQQTQDDFAVISPALKEEAVKRGVRSKIECYENTGLFTRTRLLGGHNQLNLDAAFLAVSKFGVTLEQAQRVAEVFQPIENRLENVGEWKGIMYVNDSKCTTVEALRVALQSFNRPVRLLAGGKFKGGDLAGLAPLLKERVQAVGLYGASRDVFEKAWGGVVPVSYNETLEEAMTALRSQCVSGDVILLAPACSSYDQYANYLERGEDFRRIAEKLQ